MYIPVNNDKQTCELFKQQFISVKSKTHVQQGGNEFQLIKVPGPQFFFFSKFYFQFSTNSLGYLLLFLIIKQLRSTLYIYLSMVKYTSRLHKSITFLTQCFVLEPSPLNPQILRSIKTEKMFNIS